MWNWYAEKHQRFEKWLFLHDYIWLHNVPYMTVCDNIKQRGKKVVTLDSQFFRKLVTCGYKGVSRWYRKVTMTRTDRNQVEFIEHTTTQVKLLEQDLLVVIINDRTVHWTLLVYARTYTSVHVHYTLTFILMPGYGSC